jgi:hypothetical protein
LKHLFLLVIGSLTLVSASSANAHGIRLSARQKEQIVALFVANIHGSSSDIQPANSGVLKCEIGLKALNHSQDQDEDGASLT